MCMCVHTCVYLHVCMWRECERGYLKYRNYLNRQRTGTKGEAVVICEFSPTTAFLGLECNYGFCCKRGRRPLVPQANQQQEWAEYNGTSLVIDVPPTW